MCTGLTTGLCAYECRLVYLGLTWEDAWDTVVASVIIYIILSPKLKVLQIIDSLFGLGGYMAAC